MDGDLQDPPESIPMLRERVRDGVDLVYAVRRNPQHGLVKQWTSSLFWLFLQWFTRLEIPQHQATLRIMTRRFCDALCSLPERDRFAYGYGLSALVGFKQLGVEVEHGKRVHGRSSYNMMRRIQVAASAILSLSTFPLQLSFFLGLILACAGAAACLDVLWLHFFASAAVSGTALLAALLFLGGIQMMMIGLVGLYVGRMYIQMKPYPPYFISERTASH
jgi:dolichol-phosphate mannosyltransferase